MSGFSPSIGNNNSSNQSFFQRINQLRNQNPGQRITIDDLVNRELEGSEQTQPTEESGESQSSEDASGNPAARGRTIETGREQDVTVQGDSFVALGSGESQQFARSVSLEVDSEGNVRDSISGRQLQETVEDGETETEGIQLSEEQRTSEARSTSEASFGGNLSGNIARGDSVQFEGEFTNANGETETVSLRATRTGQNQFELTAQDPESGDNALRATVNFNAEGTVESTEVQQNSRDFEGLSFGTDSGGEIQVSEESLNLSGFTFGQADGETTARVTSENGRTSGELNSLTLTEDGQLQGEFSNGETRTFGEVATAQFENSSALTNRENGLFLSNGLSGEADFSADAEFESGELETQGSENTRDIADSVLGNGDSGVASGDRRDQLLGAVFDLSA